MCYNVKRMCIKSSPLGEGKGEGPVVAVVTVIAVIAVIAVIVRRWHNIGTNWVLNY